MIMDVCRTAYSRSCNFFRGGPTGTIRWYRAPVGARVFPSWNSFGSINWLADPWEQVGTLGEQYGQSPKWDRGDTPPSAKGLAFAGPLSSFQFGQLYNSVITFDRDPFGLLSSCTGLSYAGGVGIEGGTPFGLPVGPALWLRADDLIHLGDGAKVPVWPDASGNANDATNPVVLTQPVVLTTVPGVQAVVSFGNAVFLDLTVGVAGADFTAFAVARGKSIVNHTSVILMGAFAPNDFFAWVHRALGNFLAADMARAGIHSTAFIPQPATLQNLYSVMASGVQGFSATNRPLPSVPTSPTGPPLGPWTRVGFFGGLFLCELIVYPRALTQPESDSVVYYLRDKWGLTF
jgi:hypothetical protein